MYTALDLFCGGGGSTIGLLYAGFDSVTGIDIKNQRYYCEDFIKADVLNLPVNPLKYDFVWLSPPCQRWSVSTHATSKDQYKKHPDLIPFVRDLLKDHPFYCIENVPQAPLHTSLILTGPTVDLPFIQRTRHFETNFLVWQPPIEHVPREQFRTGHALTVTKSMCSSNHFYRRTAQGLPGRPCKQEVKHAMGIPQNYNFTYPGLGEAVPPPYATYIAKQALEQLTRR